MLLEIFFASLATYGFGLMFNIRGKSLLAASIGGGIGWFFYIFCMGKDFSESSSYLIATIFIALYCEWMARILKTPVTSIIVPSMIPLAPGGGVYYTMFYLIQNNYNLSFQKALQTASIAGSMALGILIVSTLFRVYNLIKKRKKLKSI